MGEKASKQGVNKCRWAVPRHRPMMPLQRRQTSIGITMWVTSAAAQFHLCLIDVVRDMHTDRCADSVAVVLNRTDA